MLGTGLAKLAIVGMLAFGAGQAIYTTVKPDVTPRGRYSQAVQQHADWNEMTEQQRRRLLRRGIDAEAYSRLRSTSQTVPRPQPTILGRLVKKLPRPQLRIPVRVR